MKLSPLTLDRLKSMIIGDDGYFPRLKGEQILVLFHVVGFKDVYDWTNGGMPDKLSRSAYTLRCLKEINGKREIQTLLETVVSHGHFHGREESRQAAIEAMNVYLREDSYAMAETKDGIFKVTGELQPEEVKVKAHFEQHQATIIEEIRKARFTIWVAVAWLTDPVLLNELWKKQKEGLDIQIVTQDDEINAKQKDKVLERFRALYKPPRGVYKNLMHHKFCVIDLRTVVHGSYNWTVKAQYNDETVTVTHSVEHAAEFAETFKQLKIATT
jgi:phosphatidylserine/phosphatidylglycerophosphate/cardiolipin synthase-like enzyme